MLVVTSITADVVAIIGFVAVAVGVLPSPVLPAVVLIFGGACLYLVHRFVMAGSTTQGKVSMLGVTLVLTLLVTYWASNHAWPEHFPLGRHPKKSNTTAGTQEAASADASARLARGLKVTEPRKLGHIGTCALVEGTGEIPEGYQVWVANLNDEQGIADTRGCARLLTKVTVSGGSAPSVSAPKQT
ncbi:hypothetical protein AB0C98_18890 [Streptomyces sp. NPDC048558]|uniref:hypothetical protein n=1 Tax=Streptomyces sp. NPDC048558 TaxID=3155759 RepID=UPI00342325F4